MVLQRYDGLWSRRAIPAVVVAQVPPINFRFKHQRLPSLFTPIFEIEIIFINYFAITLLDNNEIAKQFRITYYDIINGQHAPDGPPT